MQICEFDLSPSLSHAHFQHSVFHSALRQINASKLTFEPGKGLFLFPHLEKGKHLLVLPTFSPFILLHRIFFFSFLKTGRGYVCPKSGESVKNEASGQSKIKTKSSLVSREELCSLELVPNSITVPFLFIYFSLKSKSEYNTRQEEKKKEKKRKTNQTNKQKTEGRSYPVLSQDIFPQASNPPTLATCRTAEVNFTQ